MTFEFKLNSKSIFLLLKIFVFNNCTNIDSELKKLAKFNFSDSPFKVAKNGFKLNFPLNENSGLFNLS